MVGYIAAWGAPDYCGSRAPDYYNYRGFPAYHRAVEPHQVPRSHLRYSLGISKQLSRPKQGLVGVVDTYSTTPLATGKNEPCVLAF